MTRPTLLLLALGVCTPKWCRGETLPQFEEAQQAFFRKDYGAALPALLRLAESPGHAPEIDLYVGVIHRDRKDFPAAIRAFRTALEAQPQNTGYCLELATTYSWWSRLDDALTQYLQCLRTAPDDPAAKAGRARMLHWLGRHPEAKVAYDAALQHHPENLELQLGSAALDFDMFDHGRSRATYEAVLRKYPSNLDATTGLTRLDEYDRCIAEAGVSLVKYVGDTDYVGARVGVGCRLTASWRALVKYESSTARELVASGPSADAMNHRAWLNNIHQLSRHIVGEWGYAVQFSEVATLHQLPLRMSHTFSPEWVGLLGVRGETTMANHGGLVDAGIQYVPRTDWWFMAQWFSYVSTYLPASGSGVLSAFHQVATSVGLRASAGLGTSNRRFTQSGSLELSVRINSSLMLKSQYEYFHGSVTRHAAQAWLEQSFW